MKISEELDNIFRAAYTQAKLRSHEYLTPEHILFSALFFESAIDIIQSCGGDVKSLQGRLEEFFLRRSRRVKVVLSPFRVPVFKTSSNGPCGIIHRPKRANWILAISSFPFSMKRNLMLPFSCSAKGLRGWICSTISPTGSRRFRGRRAVPGSRNDGKGMGRGKGRP